MKKYAIVLAALAFAACSSEPADDAAETPAAEESAAPVTANGSPAGNYDVTAADGTVSHTSLNADGTYVDTDADGKVTEEGTWAITDGKNCFSPTTEGATAMCYTEGAAAADGSFTATPDKGDPVTVKPAAAAAEPAA